MAIFLSLLTAITYGAGDFCGGLAARRSPAIQVTLISQLAGTVLLVVLVPVVGGTPTTHDLVVGGAAGLAGACAVAVFYRAMAVGAMSVIAPVSALTATALPVLFGLARGERPPPVALVGVVVAVAAILLVSQHGGSTPDDPETWREAPTSHRSAILMGLLSGVLFGILFIVLDGVADGAGLWPLVGARIASLPFLVVLSLATHTAIRPTSGSLSLIATCGAFDMLANVFLLLAFGHGLLVLVTVITSLYPASTLVLARVVLHERMRAIQKVGLAIAALAIVLISVA
jgi:drug/metabolite transporter (DMT)-like permease